MKCPLQFNTGSDGFDGLNGFEAGGAGSGQRLVKFSSVGVLQDCAFRRKTSQDFGLWHERASHHAIILRFASKNDVFARLIRSYGFYGYAPKT